MLASKLSGRALILLLFNRLKIPKTDKVLIAELGKILRLSSFSLALLHQSSQMDLKFIAFSSSFEKLINSPRWNFNLIIHRNAFEQSKQPTTTKNMRRETFFRCRDKLRFGCEGSPLCGVVFILFQYSQSLQSGEICECILLDGVQLIIC